MGRLNPCKTEKRMLHAAVQAFEQKANRPPTGVDELLTDAEVDGNHVRRMLLSRPIYWMVADDGDGTIVSRTGEGTPSACT